MVVNRFMKFTARKYNNCGSNVSTIWPIWVPFERSALQTLHKVSSKAREHNYYLSGLTHDWVSYYEQQIKSDQSCLNEWHAMDSLESRRPPSPDSVRTKPRERDETERVIRSTLKEIMMSVDLDEVTSKYIRSRLEEELDMDLGEYKSFIDQEMLVILGQMDAPTEIFDHVYLGSEWNASNLEELQKNGVGHILNVTREIDNFFPGMFDYLNIRVYDDEKTDLLKYWDNTFKYITRAKKEGSKVLVHCKMGVSRSASVVIAYAMKAYNWDFHQAIKHVKEKRTCIKPNSSFLAQLETYQGILDAMKNKEKLQRSKSETNLKSPVKSERIIPGSEPTPMIQALHKSSALQSMMSGQDLRQVGGRPKSWSPDTRVASTILPPQAPTSVSLEHLNKESSKVTFTTVSASQKTSPTETSSLTIAPNNQPTPPSPSIADIENRNVLMPCENGQIYSVSPNHIFHLPCKKTNDSTTIPSVKHRVIELESQNSSIHNGGRNQPDKKGLVLNLTTQFEGTSSKPASPENDGCLSCDKSSENQTTATFEDPLQVQTKPAPQMLTAVLVKKEIWDPGESNVATSNAIISNDHVNNVMSYKTCDQPLSSHNGDNLVWTSSTRLIETTTAKDHGNVESTNILMRTRRDGDPFSNQLDRVFEREERKQQRQTIHVMNSNAPPLPQCVTDLTNECTQRESPSRQSSWSSYDSAVVLGYQGETRDSPSRHSSWGSGDARTLPSRNSSWGSYDMRPYQNDADKKNIEDLINNTSSGMFAYDKDDIPGYPGTVKRTKQKLEENTEKKCTNLKGNVRIEPVVVQDNSDENSGGGSSAAIANCNISQEQSTITTSDNKTKTNKSPLSNSCLSVNTSKTCKYNVQKLTERPTSVICTNPDNILNSINSVVNSSVLVTSDPKEKRKTFSDFTVKNSTKQIDIVNKVKTPYIKTINNGSRLSVSAPERSSLLPSKSKEHQLPTSSSVSNILNIYCGDNNNESSSVKKHKLFLESLCHIRNRPKRCFSVDDDSSSNSDIENRTAGIVKSLKREFEAKTGTNHDMKLLNSTDSTTIDQKNTKSLPASPVSAHIDIKDRGEHNNSPLDQIEQDLSVKKLVGKYEVRQPDHDERGVVVRDETHNILKNSTAAIQFDYVNKSQRLTATNETKKYTPLTKSSLLVRNLKNGCDPEFKRPPVPPTVVKSNIVPNTMVLASVVTTAATKKQQQHGKTHPLTRLTVNKQRHNNPVYNTM